MTKATRLTLGVVLLALFSSFLIFLTTRHNFDLEGLQSLFSILGSISIGIALISYFERKDQDITTAAIDLISFFRKEIIVANDDLIKSVQVTFPNYYWFSIKLDNPDMAYVRQNFKKEVDGQEILSKNQELFSKQTLLLNMLEELSLRIDHFHIFDHPALNSIRIPFVQMVEQNAWALLFQREVFAGLPTYQTILDLYKKWKDQVDRKSPVERLKSVGKQSSN